MKNSQNTKITLAQELYSNDITIVLIFDTLEECFITDYTYGRGQTIEELLSQDDIDAKYNDDRYELLRVI